MRAAKLSVTGGKALLEAADRIYYDASECVDFRTGKKINSH